MTDSDEVIRLRSINAALKQSNDSLYAHGTLSDGSMSDFARGAERRVQQAMWLHSTAEARVDQLALTLEKTRAMLRLPLDGELDALAHEMHRAYRNSLGKDPLDWDELPASERHAMTIAARAAFDYLYQRAVDVA